jgi:hypothetical protein
MAEVPEVKVNLTRSHRPRYLEASMHERWDGLKGAWAKFHWARQHADSLEAEVTSDTNTMTLTRHPRLYPTKQPNVFVGFYVIDTMPLAPPEWGYRFGDIVHNLRCCLDYVAWQFAILDSGGDPFGLTQFAICNDDGAFKKFQWHLKSLTPDHVAFVEACQPYHAWEAFRAGRGSADALQEFIGLLPLREINDRDKHQVPTLTQSVTSERSQPALTNIRGCSRAEVAHIQPNVTLEPGTPILQVMVWDPDFDTLDMDVDYKPSLDVVTPTGESLPAVIALMFQAVENVLHGAEAHLLGPPLGLA